MTGGIRQVDDYQVRRYAEARILVADVSKSYSVAADANGEIYSTKIPDANHCKRCLRPAHRH
jgi:hypothetical protein